MTSDRYNNLPDLPEDVVAYTDDFNTRADAAVDAMADTLPANFLPPWVKAHKPVTREQWDARLAATQAAVAKLYEPTRGADVETGELPVLRMTRKQAGAL